MDDSALTPFACVTFFQAHSQEEMERELTYPEFLAWLEDLLPSPNLFYAIRIDGVFPSLTVRSVPKQEAYRPLAEAVKEQSVYEFKAIEGTLAGFFTPRFMGTLNVPGLHLHFISADRRHGGHLLGCTSGRMRVSIQFIRKVELNLPITLDYLTLDLQPGAGARIKGES